PPLKSPPFPYTTLFRSPGHFVEWAKLLVILDRHNPAPWHLPAAEHLFNVASEKAWDPVRGGMNYAFAPDGTILDTDRYHWVTSEDRKSTRLNSSHVKIS